MTDNDLNDGSDRRLPSIDEDDVSRRDVMHSAADDSGAGRRGFGKLLLAGAAAAAGMSASASACDWREGYDAYMDDAIPEFYDIAPTEGYVQLMIDHQAENTPIFEMLGEQMDLSESEIVNSYVRPKPCGGPPIEWDDLLDELLGDDFPPYCDPRYCDPPGFICPECVLEIDGPEGRADLHLDLLGNSFGYYFDGDPVPLPFDESGWGEASRGHVGDGVELPW